MTYSFLKGYIMFSVFIQRKRKFSTLFNRRVEGVGELEFEETRPGLKMIGITFAYAFRFVDFKSLLT